MTATTANLPAPVRRYLQATGRAGAPLPARARVRQTGMLRSAAGTRWMRFTAEQTYTMEPPGFVWRARVHMAPLVHVSVRDTFACGHGRTQVRLLGWVPLADRRGPGIDRGAALRHWAEVAAFAEMVASPRLRWMGVDDRRARVMIDTGLEAIAEFDDQGLLSGIRARRDRDVHGPAVRTPWSGRFTNWSFLDGRLFPRTWESVWEGSGGREAVVRINVHSVATE